MNSFSFQQIKLTKVNYVTQITVIKDKSELSSSTAYICFLTRVTKSELNEKQANALHRAPDRPRYHGGAGGACATDERRMKAYAADPTPLCPRCQAPKHPGNSGTSGTGRRQGEELYWQRTIRCKSVRWVARCPPAFITQFHSSMYHMPTKKTMEDPSEKEKGLTGYTHTTVVPEAHPLQNFIVQGKKIF